MDMQGSMRFKSVKLLGMAVTGRMTMVTLVEGMLVVMTLEGMLVVMTLVEVVRMTVRTVIITVDVTLLTAASIC